MGTSFKWIGMIRATRVEQPAAEAKKAEGASWAALLMPSPPRLTGRVAWVQDETEAGRHMLVTLLVMVLSRSSNSASSGETKQGEVRRVYDNLGIARECRRRRRESCAWRYLSLSPKILRDSTFSRIDSLIHSMLSRGDPNSQEGCKSWVSYISYLRPHGIFDNGALPRTRSAGHTSAGPISDTAGR